MTERRSRSPAIGGSLGPSTRPLLTFGFVIKHIDGEQGARAFTEIEAEHRHGRRSGGLQRDGHPFRPARFDTNNSMRDRSHPASAKLLLTPPATRHLKLGLDRHPARRRAVLHRPENLTSRAPQKPVTLQGRDTRVRPETRQGRHEGRLLSHDEIQPQRTSGSATTGDPRRRHGTGRQGPESCSKSKADLVE